MKNLLTENELNIFNKFDNDFTKKLFFALLMLSKQNNGFVTKSKSEILKIINCRRSQHSVMYDDCICQLLTNQNIKIIDGYIFIEIENNIDISHEDIDDIGVYYEYYFGQSTVKECPYCKRLFIPTANNQKYCVKHRGYIKIGYVTRKCCDCNKEFTVHSYCRNKIRCDSCQKEYTKTKKRIYMQKYRENCLDS